MIKKQVCCLRHHFWGWTLAPINLDPYPIPQPQRNPEAIKPGTQVCRRRRNLNRNRHNKQDAQIAPRRVKDQHRSFSVSGEGPRTQGLKGLKDSRTQGLKAASELDIAHPTTRSATWSSKSARVSECDIERMRGRRR